MGYDFLALIKSRTQTFKVICLLFKDNTVPAAHPPQGEGGSWQPRHFPGEASCSGFLKIDISPLPISQQTLSGHARTLLRALGSFQAQLRASSPGQSSSRPCKGRAAAAACACPGLAPCSCSRDGLGAAAEHIKVTSTSPKSPAAHPLHPALSFGMPQPILLVQEVGKERSQRQSSSFAVAVSMAPHSSSATFAPRCRGSTGHSFGFILKALIFGAVLIYLSMPSVPLVTKQHQSSLFQEAHGIFFAYEQYYFVYMKLNGP